MQKISKTAIAASLVAVSLFLGACSGAVGGGGTITPYSLISAPKAITVDVPSSLVKPTAVAKALASSRGMGLPSAASFFNDENRGAYHWIKESMWQAQKRLARAAAKLVLVDTVIAANGLGPAAAGAASTHQAATIDHVWTDAEVAAVEALLPPSFVGNAAFGNEAKLPVAGEKVNLPAFDYSAVDAVADAVNAAYALKVSFVAQQSEDDSAAAIQETNDFYWTSDRASFKYAHSKTDSSTSPAKTLEMNFVAYDGASKTLASGRQGREGSMSLQVKADPASTASGVFIAFNSTILADKAEDYTGDSSVAAGSTFSFSAEGYADDAGGYVNETFVLSAGGASTTYYFKESFDAAGKLVLAQSSADATFAALTDITGVVGEGSGALGSYSGKEAEVRTEHQAMDASGPSQEIQKEERHHAGEVAGAGVDLEFAFTKGPTPPATDPVVGETWAVSDNVADFTGTHLLGSGVVTERGHLRVAFAARPADGVKQVFIAKLSGVVADTANVITVPFDR